MAANCQVYGVIHFTSPAGWLPVHRDQLRAQRSVTSMGKLCLLPIKFMMWSTKFKKNKFSQRIFKALFVKNWLESGDKRNWTQFCIGPVIIIAKWFESELLSCLCQPQLARAITSVIIENYRPAVSQVTSVKVADVRFASSTCGPHRFTRLVLVIMHHRSRHSETNINKRH